MGNKKLIHHVMERTKQAAVHITVLPDQNTTCLDSKFGGSFYLPDGMDAPHGPDGKEMEFMAQINLSQLSHLPDFPRQGILQFFLCTDEEVMDEMADNDGIHSSSGYFQVRYYPEAKHVQFLHEEQRIENRWPMEKLTGGMCFVKTEEAATLSIGENGFETVSGCEDVIDALAPKLLEKAGYDLSECSDTDRFCLDFGNWGCKLGGYPAIRQGDIRLHDNNYQDHMTLLFQLDFTPYEQGELEADTFCFFIKSDDLKACHFDDILLCWHNCF